MGRHAHTASIGPPLPTGPTDSLEHAQNSTVVALLQQLLGAIQRKEGEPGRREGGGSGGEVRKVEGELKINVGVNGRLHWVNKGYV